MTILNLTKTNHQWIDELLLLHQEALVAMEFPLALEIWQSFTDVLRTHIATENASVLPLAEPLADSLRWPASLYRHEHNKILDLIGRIETRLQGLTSAGTPNKRRAVIALIDYQRSFKNVIEHHEEREEMALLPELEGLLDAADYQQALSAMESNWQSGEDLESVASAYRARLE